MINKIVIFLMVSLFAISGVAFADVVSNSGSVSGAAAGAAVTSNNNNMGNGASTSDSGATSGSSVVIDSHDNNISQDNRGFAIPGNVQYGPVINYFTKPLPSAGFQPVEEILMYGCFFTEGALEEVVSGGGTDAFLKIVNANPQARPAPEDGKTRWIKIVIQKAPLTGLQFKGFVTATSDSVDVTMVQVMGKAALESLRKGANVVHFTAQGAVRDAFSSGWGIGFGTTFAKLYNADGNQDVSGVGYGGFGYSKAKAQVRDLPWLQGFALVDPALVYPKLEVAPSGKTADTTASAAPTQTGNHVPKK